MSLLISWHGVSCFTIKAKINDELVAVVTDPYDSSCGLRVPKTFEANIVTVSQKHPHHNNIEVVKSLRGDKDVFVIKSPGEYEIGDIFIYGVPSSADAKDSSMIYRFEINGFSLVHLGNLNYEPSSKELEIMGETDILFVPVDDEKTIGIKKIINTISAIDPRVVVPMNYRIQNLKIKSEPVEKLLKELGVKEVETVKKLKISRKDITEEMKVIVIEKE